MFYLTSKFHVNRINSFGFMEGGGLLKPPPPQTQELQKSPGRIGLRKKQPTDLKGKGGGGVDRKVTSVQYLEGYVCSLCVCRLQYSFALYRAELSILYRNFFYKNVRRIRALVNVLAYIQDMKMFSYLRIRAKMYLKSQAQFYL